MSASDVGVALRAQVLFPRRSMACNLDWTAPLTKVGRQSRTSEACVKAWQPCSVRLEDGSVLIRGLITGKQSIIALDLLVLIKIIIYIWSDGHIHGPATLTATFCDERRVSNSNLH